MNNIQKVEYNNILVLTTQQIAEAYGTDYKVISKNFKNNEDRYIEGKHFICLTGEELRQAKANRKFYDLQMNANKFYLWTQKGAFLHAKSLNTDTAWEVYDRLVDSYFQSKENITVSELSPELQMFKSLWDMQAKQELEQKRQAEQIAKVESKVETMKEIFTKPISNWRAEMNSSVRKISIKSGIEFQLLYNKMYRELECTAHCKLKTRCSNREQSMIKAGKLKSEIKEGTKIITIIEEDPKLKVIFENIVRRYEMSYCV